MSFKRSEFKKMSIKYLSIMYFLLYAVNFGHCGPLSGAICSAGCASLVVACYAGAGAVFGTVTAGVGTPAAVVVNISKYCMSYLFEYHYNCFLYLKYRHAMLLLENAWQRVPQQL